MIVLPPVVIYMTYDKGPTEHPAYLQKNTSKKEKERKKECAPGTGI